MYWKKINNFENYEINCLGQIRNKNKKILKFDNSNGYSRIILINKNEKKRFFVHRLIYENFIGPIPKDFQINHIDFNKLNNNLSNLECVTCFENNLHSSSRNNFKLNLKIIKEIRENLDDSKTISKKYNINLRQINRILNNQAWFDSNYFPTERIEKIKLNKKNIKKHLNKEIAEKIRKSNLSKKELIELYNVSRKTIENILNYKSFK